MGDSVVFGLARWGYILGYTVLFLLFGLFWSRLFFGSIGQLRHPTAWPSLSFGAFAFFLTLRIQIPLQQAANAWGVAQGLSIWAVGTIIVLISGFVQEALKLAGIKLGSTMTNRQVNWLLAGLAVGLGFGVWEAWQLVAWPLGAATQWIPIAVLERFSAIGMHIGVAVISAYGLAKRRPLPYFLIAALLHTAGNFSALLYQQWVLGLWGVEVYILAVSLVSLGLARFLVKRVETE